MIEPLEPRIAPAFLFHYTDVDGDFVIVRVSKGELSDAALVFDATGHQLQRLSLNHPSFAGADVSIMARRVAPTGDGHVHVGFLDAGELSDGLGRVQVDGDLGKVLINAPFFSASGVLYSNLQNGVQRLEVESIGVFGLATGAPDALSIISGEIGTLIVHGDIDGAYVRLAGNVQSLTIGGSLRGGEGPDSGSVVAVSDVRSAVIKGSLFGAAGDYSGHFGSDGGTVHRLWIGGSVRGGEGAQSGTLGPHREVSFPVEGPQFGGAFGRIEIRGDVIGGAGAKSGGLYTPFNVGDVLVRGSLLDEAFLQPANATTIAIRGDLAGEIDLSRAERIRIGGSVLGEDVERNGTPNGIDAFFTVESLFIGGDIHGGAAGSSATVRIDGVVDRFYLGGSVVGGAGIGSGRLLLPALRTTSIIRGDIHGGDGDGSGFADVSASIWLGGSVLGGGGEDSGVIETGNLWIRGSIAGGSGDGSGTARAIGNVEVRGSLLAGSGEKSGSVHAGFRRLVIYGDVTGTADHRAQVVAGGLGFSSLLEIQVRGDVCFADILVGYGFDGDPLDGANAKLELVQIDGDVRAANIVSGVLRGADGQFGTEDDRLIATGPGGEVQARIGEIIVRGKLLGTGQPDEHFGIVSGILDRVRIGPTLYRFDPAVAGEVRPLPGAGNVTLREVIAV